MNVFCYNEIKIYNSIFEYIDSNMYIMVEDSEALIVDPHKNDEVFKLLKNNNVKKISILLTHEHADHISGIRWLQENFKSILICSKSCAEYISVKKNIGYLLIGYILDEQDKKNGTNLSDKFNKDFVLNTYKADVVFEKEYQLKWKTHNLKFYAVLGHSEGSCIIIFDGKIVFAGDSLLKKFPVITRFPGGNKQKYIQETLPFLEKILSSKMQILPGHGTPFVLEEIMKAGKINVAFR